MSTINRKEVEIKKMQGALADHKLRNLFFFFKRGDDLEFWGFKSVQAGVDNFIFK